MSFYPSDTVEEHALGCIERTYVLILYYHTCPSYKQWASRNAHMAALRMGDQRWGTRTPVTRAARPGIGSLSAGNIAASLTKIDGDRD